MGKITKIEDQKNKKRFNIFVDDAFFCGLNKEVAVIAGLSEGKVVDEERLKQLIKDSEIKTAFDKAIALLSAKSYFESEIKTKLIQKGYEKDIVFSVLEKLREYKYIDDFSLASHYVKVNSKYSSFMLKNKLKQKGVSQKIIDEIFGEENNNDYEILRGLVEKYLKSNKIKDEKSRNKLFSHFFRKGFDIDLIKKCSKEFIDIEND